MEDDLADIKDPLLLLNSLNASTSSSPSPMRMQHKRRLIPNFEVERQACGDLKKIKMKIPIRASPPADIMVSPSGEIIPKKDWVDTDKMVDEISNFMKTYKVTQSKIARKLGIGQMWLSRMMCAPRQYDILQETGRGQCRKLWNWLQQPEEERAIEIINEQGNDDYDDNEEVDTIEMVKQMQEEIECYNVSVSDYAKGSGVKYSWVYSLLKTPNIYDSFNMSGKRQARTLNRYLNLPLNQRAEMWKFTKDESKSNALDTVEIRTKVRERFQNQNLSAKAVCFQLQIEYPRFQQLFLQPIPWENLNLPGRRIFAKLNEWLQSGGDLKPVKLEIEETDDIVVIAPSRKPVQNGRYQAGRYPPLDTQFLVKSVKREMKLLKLTALQLGDHLDIRNLQDLMQNAGRWEKFDESMKEEYHILNRWMEESADKRIIEAQIIQGTFDPTTSYAQKLLADQIKQDERAIEPLITGEIKEEDEEEDRPATTPRLAWQTPRAEKKQPIVTKLVSLGFPGPSNSTTKRLVPVKPKSVTSTNQDSTRPNPNSGNDITITVDLPSMTDLIKAATCLIEQKMKFSVGLDKISMTSAREDVSNWLSFFSENGFPNVHVSC